MHLKKSSYHSLNCIRPHNSPTLFHYRLFREKHKIFLRKNTSSCVFSSSQTQDVLNYVNKLFSFLFANCLFHIKIPAKSLRVLYSWAGEIKNAIGRLSCIVQIIKRTYIVNPFILCKSFCSLLCFIVRYHSAVKINEIYGKYIPPATTTNCNKP